MPKHVAGTQLLVFGKPIRRRTRFCATRILSVTIKTFVSDCISGWMSVVSVRMSRMITAIRASIFVVTSLMWTVQSWSKHYLWAFSVFIPAVKVNMSPTWIEKVFMKVALCFFPCFTTISFKILWLQTKYKPRATVGLHGICLSTNFLENKYDIVYHFYRKTIRENW